MTMKYILSFSLALCTLASCQSNDAMEETLHSAKEVVRNNVFRLKPLKHSAKTPQINQDATEAEDQVSSVVIAGKAATQYDAAKAEIKIPSANRTRNYTFVANLSETDGAEIAASADKYTTAEYKTADYLRGYNGNDAKKVIPMVATLENVRPDQFVASTEAGASEYDYVYNNGDVILKRVFSRVEFETFPLPADVTVTALKVVNVPGKFSLAAPIENYDQKNAADATNYPYVEIPLQFTMDKTRRIKQVFYIPEHAVSNPQFQDKDVHSMTCISMTYTQGGKTQEARLKIASTDAGKHGALHESNNGKVVRNTVYRCWIDLERVRSFGSTEYWWAN